MTTRDEIMAMTDDELRLAVAKACGYRWYGVDKEAWLAMPGRTGLLPCGVVEIDNPSDGDELHIKSPNYPRDIVAAYALEDALPVERRNDYAIHLHDIVLRRQGVCADWDMVHASAADRCRAWLLTMEAKP